MDSALSLARWKYMVATGLWPKRANFDPSAWMANFTGDEIPLATRLLDGFTYFSDELTRQMFRSAFLSLSSVVVKNKHSHSQARGEWASFVNSTIVVRVTGELPSDADSGFTFSRLARDVLLIEERNIMAPELALEVLAQGLRRNVLFVDDFVGSGNQFCETWERPYHTRYGQISFQELTRHSAPAAFYYCPVICTSLGHDNILKRCGAVIKILPAHFYGSKESALTNDSIIWREDMRSEGPEFVKSASARAGIPDRGGGEGCWQGFHKLGLALAFSHGYPDATLPIFYADTNGWRPLIRKGAL